MLHSMAQYIADSVGTAPVSMVAERDIAAGGRITLQETAGGEPYIALQLPFPRAWASLGLALEKSDFEITDRDRSKGEYYLLYNGPGKDEEKGWFGSLWAHGKKAPGTGEHFVATVQADGDAAVKIFLRPQEGEKPLAPGDHQALLTLLKGNIN